MAKVASLTRVFVKFYAFESYPGVVTKCKLYATVVPFNRISVPLVGVAKELTISTKLT